MRLSIVSALGAVVILLIAIDQPRSATPPNIVLFVPDGLRALSVNASTAPTLLAFGDAGVSFTNSHSLMPTVTTANASAMATGHYLGDTGIFSNTLYSTFAVRQANGSVTPFLENDGVIADMDEHFGGDALNETTILAAARKAGYHTAVIGKLGPALVFDHTNRSGDATIIIDDSTGKPGGIPLSARTQELFHAAGLPLAAPGRGENAKQGTSTTPGTLVANVEQQDYFVDVATKALLPYFKQQHQPFVLVFWSRDPDGSQHLQGDSLNDVTTGINGPTSAAAIRNADRDFARLMASLESLGLANTTDVFVAADHGFSTISKQSATSAAAHLDYNDVPRGFLPPGFLAIDLALALKMHVYDPDNKNSLLAPQAITKRANGLVGTDPNKPAVVVAANGGSDLIYLPSRDRSLAERVFQVLAAQDYTSAIFADDTLGTFPGSLPLSAINLDGNAVVPKPAFVVGFRTFATACPQPVLCAVEVSDTTMQHGQGNHGSFGRGDTMNFMAASGPDLKKHFADPLPVSNADVGVTLFRLLNLTPSMKGTLVGRVMTEALISGGPVPKAASISIRASGSTSGMQTVLMLQRVGDVRYFDAAGSVGRTLGLK